MIMISKRMAIVFDLMIVLLFLFMFFAALLFINGMQSQIGETEAQKINIQDDYTVIDDLTTSESDIFDDKSIIDSNDILISENDLNSVRDFQIQTELANESNKFKYENNQFAQKIQTNQKDNPKNQSVTPIQLKIAKSNSDLIPQPILNSDFQIIHENKSTNKFYYSVGLSPLTFYGNNFITNYFMQNKITYAPTLLFGYIFSQGKFGYSINIQSVISQLSLNKNNYFFNNPIDLSSLFFSTLFSFSLVHILFSPSNLLDYHFGFGITGFAKNTCNFTEINHQKTSLNITGTTGISYKHFFNSNYFAGILVDVNCIFGKNNMFYLQPALFTGFYF